MGPSTAGLAVPVSLTPPSLGDRIRGGDRGHLVPDDKGYSSRDRGSSPVIAPCDSGTWALRPSNDATSSRATTPLQAHPLVERRDKPSNYLFSQQHHRDAPYPTLQRRRSLNRDGNDPLVVHMLWRCSTACSIAGGNCWGGKRRDLLTYLPHASADQRDDGRGQCNLSHRRESAEAALLCIGGS